MFQTYEYEIYVWYHFVRTHLNSSGRTKKKICKFFENRDELFHNFWIESFIFFFENKFHYNSFNKTIYNQLKWENTPWHKEFFWNLDELLHILCELKVLCEKCFIYIMRLRNILSDVKADIMKLFIFYIYIYIEIFSFFLKKRL